MKNKTEPIKKLTGGTNACFIFASLLLFPRKGGFACFLVLFPVKAFLAAPLGNGIVFGAIVYAIGYLVEAFQ